MKLKFGNNKNVSEMSVAGIAPTDNRASSLIRPQFAGVKSTGSEFSDDLKAMYGDSFKGKVNINFGVNKVDVDTSSINEKNNLFDNIRAKQERIKKGSKERMKRPGEEGYPEHLEKIVKENIKEHFTIKIKFSNINEDYTYEEIKKMVALEESFFKSISLRFTKFIIGIMPNNELDKIMEKIIKDSNLKDINISKLKSVKRERKVKMIKDLLDKAIKNVDKSKASKLEKESQEIVNKVKKDSADDNLSANKVAGDTVKAVGTSMRNLGLVAIIAPIVATIGTLPAIAIGAVLASGLYEKITSNFN
jgi:hypothetical protein